MPRLLVDRRFEPSPGTPSEFEPTLIATSDNAPVMIDNVFNW